MSLLSVRRAFLLLSYLHLASSNQYFGDAFYTEYRATVPVHYYYYYYYNNNNNNNNNHFPCLTAVQPVLKIVPV